MNKKIFLFIFGMFFLFGMLSFVSADYRFENNSGTTLMRLHSSNGNLSVLGNISTNNYFIGDGRFITNIDTSSLNLSSINYWNKFGSDLYYNEGNVGIGTTAPTRKLSVSDAMNIVSSDSGFGLLAFGDSTDDNQAQILYDHSVDKLSIQTGGGTGFGGGRDRLVIDTTGNVGIGTTSPSEKLQVHGGASAGTISITSNTFTTGTDVGSLTFRHTNAWNSNNVAQIKGVLQGNVGGWSYGDLVLLTGSGTTPGLAERMRITSRGNVGIGTTNPNSKLQVAGNASIGGILYMDNNKISNLANGTLATDAVTKSQLDAINSALSGNVSDTYVPYTGATQNVVLGENNFSVGGSDLFVDSSTGNVGIGTSSPGYKLDVQGNVNAYNLLINGSAVATTGSANITGAGTSNYLSKWTSGSNLGDSVIYDDGTNVGIGTTNPSYKLDINGNNVDIGFGYNVYNSENFHGVGVYGVNPSLVLNNSGSSESYHLAQLGDTFRIYNPGGNGYVLTVNDGKFGIGTTSPQQKLHVTGNVVVNGTINTDGNKIINLANGTTAQDAVTLSQLQAVSAGSIGAVTGSGSAMRVALWNGTSSLNNSNIYQGASGNIGVGTQTPSSKLEVNGTFDASSNGGSIKVDSSGNIRIGI